MTPDEAVHAMAVRLSLVDWERRGDKAWSKAALLKEYFRRAARWAIAYGCDTRVPFFDIAACVNSSIRADQNEIDHLLEKIVAGRGGWNAKQMAPFILHWAALRATPDIALPPELEDPFEPIVLLFERGGGFHTEHGEVNLEWLSVPTSGWRKRADAPPMLAFTPEVLDEIDRAGSIAQFGHVIEPL
ncbi:hypothetical protein [Actinoplanes siamensis]|uniref:Uncharacterized protein n=1 Tax=Actinoplanes siamensis TaxID=1223317 RepID=A0A919ND08_9ACTN|nr:hypothetical protein [Actinoplanes siamensis]GIF08923.1 hypothetical protein Asi03nite_64610 [Actinoplanes siamensis]